MKEQEKKNIFGSKFNTPGQNLIEEITKATTPIGIPPYNYGEMFKIFDKALTEEEKELLCRGFGFGRERQLQKEIAEELKMDPNQVSQLARKAVKKLQASPYKGQLKKLVPSLDEVLELAKKGLQAEAEGKKESELYFKYKAAKQSEERIAAKLKTCETKLSKAEYEQENLTRKIEEMKAEGESQKAIILELEEKLTHERAVITSAREAYRKMESKIFDTPSSTPAAEDLGLTDDVVKRLRRVGIKDTKTLCGMTPSSLSKMGIGQKGISEIKEALKNKGLSLRS